MRTPDLAEKIVGATVGAAHVPVTVKIRKGFYAEDRNAATFAQMLEGAGAAAVAVHGRCATQLYTGQADWSVVDEVADAWTCRECKPLDYAAGSWGPETADLLLSRTGRKWNVR